MLLIQLDRCEEAKLCFQEALKLDSSNFASNYNHSVFKKLGQIDEAFVCVERALRLNPDSPIALNRLGEILLERKHDQEAVKFYSYARNFPDDRAILNNYGIALQNVKRFADAICQYRSALSIDKTISATLNLAICIGMDNKLEDALKCFEEARILQPENQNVTTIALPFCSNIVGSLKPLRA